MLTGADSVNERRKASLAVNATGRVIRTFPHQVVLVVSMMRNS